MKIIVTEAELLKIITSSSKTRNGLIKLRELVFNYYYNEDNYEFDKSTEDAFTVLSPYLEMEEAVGDDLFSTRMSRLAYIVEDNGWSRESLIVALYFDDIMALNKKVKSHVIDDSTYRKKIEDLTPVVFNYSKLVELADKYRKNLTNM